MLDGLVPDLAPRLLIAIGGVAIAFLVLIAVLLFLRRRNSPLFIKGGRAREHRLQVLDAAAVDAKRRLVLIKRDDTEHLIMIGGPTDIVIETGIAVGGRPRAAAVAQPTQRPADQPVVVQRPAAANKPAERAAPAASNIVPIAARPAEAAGAQRPNQGRPEGERRQGREQNGERGFNQRRLERQAARAAEAAKSADQPAAADAGAKPAMPDEKREPVRNGGTPASENNQAAAAVQKANPAAAAAENTLDQARARAMSPPLSRNAPLSNEDAIRQLEEQLEAGKSEAARAEAARAEAARAEQAKAEAARAEAARLEAERAAAARADAERAEAVHAEAARLEAMRLEAQKAEAARLEAERAERMRHEAERAEAERAEAARIAAERAEAARVEAARAESERIAAARAEAMARFEAARRAQAEQRSTQQQPMAAEQAAVAQQTAEERQPPEEKPALQQAQWPVAEPAVAAASAEEEPQWPVMQPPVAEPATAYQEPGAAETAELDDAASKSQQRLASDFEKLLEAELEADGILDHYATPAVAGERREPGLGVPTVDPAERSTQPITGAVPGLSVEHDMARRLGEISLNKKSDAV